MRLQLPEGYFTYISAISVNLLSYGGGLGYGWSSPALPKLSGNVDPENNPLSRPTTVHEESWIASLLSLGAMCSPFVIEIMSEKIGRKKTLLSFAFPIITGYLIMAVANEVYHFYIARFLVGLTEGCIFGLIPVYSAEISQKHNRGSIGNIMLCFICLGHLTSSVVGPYVTIRTFSIISLIPCILFVIIFGIFIPETPYYYVLNDKKLEAEESLRKLRRREDIDEEMQEIVKGVTELRSSKDASVLKELFTTSNSLKAFALALTLMLFQQFTGLIYVIDYTQGIFDSAQTPLSSDISVIIVMIVQLLSIITSTHIIDRVARKSLLYISLGMIITLQTLMGLFFYLKEQKFDLIYISWLPIMCLMLFIMAFQGIGPVSYIFPGEIFEPTVKSLGTTLVVCIGLFAEFAIAMFFPLVADNYGVYTPFFIFACTSFAAAIFVWYCIPETGGKSFLEIQENMRKRKF